MFYSWVSALEVCLIGISLAMDALAVSVTDGLCYKNLTKGKGISIPLTFGIFQALMPLAGFFVAYVLGQAFSELFDAIDHWIAFLLLSVIGAKMLLDAIKELRSKEEDIAEKHYSFPEVIVQGVATSIDALFVGVSFAVTEGLKNSISAVLLSVGIIGVITFVISLTGLIIGVKIGNVLKNKTGITGIIGGLVLIGIGLKILIQGLI